MRDTDAAGCFLKKILVYTYSSEVCTTNKVMPLNWFSIRPLVYLVVTTFCFKINIYYEMPPLIVHISRHVILYNSYRVSLIAQR